jgi:hypothetical protein
MDVYQATMVCAECKQSNRVIITAEVSSAPCENCNANLVRLKRYDGVIYVMKNSRVGGVKIGMTQRDVFRRAKQVSGTGVPGDFEVLAAFPSTNAARDERKIHEKLKSKKIKKEHFELEPVAAIVKVRSILNRRDWVYIKRSLRAPVEARIEEQKQLLAARLGAGDQPRFAQADMFADSPTVEQSPSEGEKTEGDRKPRGFLVNLFQS